METPALNLLILDDNKVIAGELSNYLNTRFGTRIKIAAFLDAELGIQNIKEQSHVIILNYSLPNETREPKKGQRFFNSIKRKNPKTKVAIITSDKDVANATEEMKRETSKYIMKRRLLNSVVNSPYKTIVLPIKTVIAFPIIKVIHYYKINDYLMMFFVAFASMGIFVLAVFLSLQLLGR
jgi:ActR/RegA family two-component response regulator